METAIRAMMNFISSEVCGKEIDKSQYAFTDEALAELYKLSKFHDLANLVGAALIKNDLIQNAELKAKFEKQQMLAVYRYEKINYELCCLRKVMNEAGIPFIPLKGSVIRKYYPEPWMRTSCDIDVLVHEDNVERTAQLLIDKMAYRYASKGSHDIGFFSEGGVHIELHYCLIEKKCVGTMEKVLTDAWKYATPVADTAEYIFDDEMFYYYHIAHMAKHFVSAGGCGIRPFLDAWVLNHRIDFDREKRERLLAEGGLLTFATEAEVLSEVWFGEGEHTGITRQMQDYLLQGGVYGTIQNRVAVQQVKRGGKFRYAISRIWLPYDDLRFHYPSLEGKKALLPFYEVRRWCKLLFCGGAKRGMNELRSNAATTEAEHMRAKEMLSKLEIDK